MPAATKAKPETAETPAPQNDASTGGARPRPTYKAEKVTELPPDLTYTRSGPRTDPAFTEAMQVAQSDPGELYCVATFQSVGGAKTLLKKISKGDVKVPEGEWEFETRRITAPDNAEKRWSKLYAKLVG